jgi:hypothetical protein
MPVDNSLQKELRPFSVKKVADEAQVSTSTITKILNDHQGVIDDLNTLDDKGRPSRRRFKGFIQSLVKLCIFLDLDPYSVIDEYTELPFDTKFVMKVMNEVGDYLGFKRKDVVSDINVGICKWEPFWEDARSAEESWGGRLSKRLIKSISPYANINFVEITNLEIAIKNANLPSNHPNKLDLIFGLYETPSRVFEGLDFISLPGIEARLGALFPSQKQLHWDDIFEKLISNCSPVIIESDIGFSFVIGAVGVDIQNCVVIKEFEIELVYQNFLNAFHLFLLKQKEGNEIGWPCLLAEQNTIIEIEKRITVDLINPDSRLCKIVKECEDVLNASFYDFFQVSDKTNLLNGPTYSVGIAVSYDSDIFDFEDVEFAFKKELFENAAYITANEYKKLIASDLVNHAMKICPRKTPNYDAFWDCFEELNKK